LSTSLRSLIGIIPSIADNSLKLIEVATIAVAQPADLLAFISATVSPTNSVSSGRIPNFSHARRIGLGEGLGYASSPPTTTSKYEAKE